MLRLINRVLWPFRLVVLPAPPSSQMLVEYANVGECHHPSRGGRTVAWMRRAASAVPLQMRGL